MENCSLTYPKNLTFAFMLLPAYLGNPDLTLQGQLLCLFRKAFITRWA